jgi:cytoskeletal protein CcmA (bactofilin family)
MFGKSQSETAANHRDSASAHKMPPSAVASSAAPEVSSISSGLSIVGKIVGHGALTIFGQVEGEVRASTVVIAEGAEMEGDVVAEELTIGGHVKGTIHANRVKLNSTAVVEGDIFHRNAGDRGECAIRGNVTTGVQYDRYAIARISPPGRADRRQP